MSKNMASIHINEGAKRLGIKSCVANLCCDFFDKAQDANEPERNGFLRDFESSAIFSHMSTVVILLNTIETAVAADFEIRHGEMEQPPFVYWSELFFLGFYCVELSVKLAVHGWYFFVNADWAWNNLDVLLIVQFIFEQIAEQRGGTDHMRNGGSMTFMRLLRLMRIVRALRVIKIMRIFGELWLIMESFSASLGSLLWFSFMIFFVIFIFALIVLQGATTYINGGGLDYDEAVAEQMRGRFGSMPLCMISMYKAGTGGQSWEVFYDLLDKVGWFYSAVFIFFTLFYGIVVSNIIVGMMVDKVLKTALADRERYALKWRVEKTKEHMDFVKTIAKIERGAAEFITWDEFQQHLLRPDADLASQFAALDLDIKSAEIFFKSMQLIYESESIPIEAFIRGCIRMAGNASSIDLHMLSVQLNAVHKQQMRMLKGLSTKVKEVGAALEAP